jgi:hypothetical protein
MDFNQKKKRVGNAFFKGGMIQFVYLIIAFSKAKDGSYI